MSSAKRSSRKRSLRRKRVKVVLIGSASACFGPQTVIDILLSEDLRGLEMDLCLVDIDEANLDAVYRFALAVAEHVGRDVRLSRTTDRCEALPGANYVVTSVARRREELWNLDFRVPLALGLKHIYG